MPEETSLEKLQSEISDLKKALADLQESEKEYRLLYDSIPDAILVTDTERRIIHCNHAFTKLFGYTLDEIKGEKTSCLYQDQAEFRKLGEAIKSHAHSDKFFYTVAYRKNSGEVFPGESHVFYLRDTSGNVTGVMGLLRDITDRLEAEQRLEHLNSVLRAIRDVNQLIFREKDRTELLTKTCEILIQTRGFDHAWIAILDEEHNLLSAHQAGIGREFRTLTALMEQGRFPECVSSIMKQTELFFAPDLDKCAACPLAPKYGESRGVCLRLQYAEKIFGVLAVRFPPGRALDNEEMALLREVADDIALALHALDLEEARIRSEQDLREREKALAEAERRYRTLFERIPVGLYRTTPEGRILEANPALVEVLGFPDRETLLATNVSELYVRKEDRVRQHEILESYGELRGFEAEIYRYDGNTIWVKDTADAVREDDGRVYLEGSLVDVSEQKRAEKERDRIEAQLRHSQKLEAVGRLAGGVAHDFNNMLNVILGYADLALTRTAPGERLHRDIQEIHLAAERSAQLTKQLLAFSRKQIIDPKVVDLNHEISRQLNLFRRIMGEDVEIIFSPAEDLWPVKMDPSQIDQILANLSTNARDALPGAGSVTIETSNVTLDPEYQKLHPYAEPADYVLLCFSDSGSGIDPELLDHIFEPFFTTKTKEKGTGLGLATVYGIVKQNKGLIHVYSEPGKGSTFKIYLPRFQGEKLSLETKHKERPMRGNETILVVEDEDQVLDLSKKILERYDYTVLTASRPDKALELVRNHPDPIHLLLTDVIMPVMSGKELKEKIQEIIPDIKVLYMSGYTARVITQQGTMEEGVEFIQKPFSVNDLANKVRTILSSDPPQTTR